MLARRFVTIAFAVLIVSATWSTNSFAGTKLYEGRWIAESFANDIIGVGTGASRYFNVNAVPLGAKCHATNPKCNIISTPVTTTGTSMAPGANGTVWAPLGPGCRALTTGETPRPGKGGTGSTVSGRPAPPLYRNPVHFTGGGAPYTTSCSANNTVSGSYATAYSVPFGSGRGTGQYGAPVIGSGIATTTAPGNAKAFNFPAALATAGSGNGMRRETKGSFIGSGNYLYSYTYADLRNDAGDFGAGKGFFSTAAAPTKLTFYAGTNLTATTPTIYATVNVTRGTNSFGGVMKLLGTYNTKVCYFYNGGCGLGYNTWNYQAIGAQGSKAGGVLTQSFTTYWTFSYFNTGPNSIATYTGIGQRFPWTTGTVRVHATYRGYEDTDVQRKGFDNRDSAGVGTVQLVSPILTQWLSADPEGSTTDTGGVAVMQIKFAPEPGGIASLIAGLSMLVVLHRSRR